MMYRGSTRVASFTEFWPIYLEAHSDRRCRALHYVGTTGAALCLVLWAVTGNLWFAPATLVVGYGFAWLGHVLFQQNTPLTLRHPLWSFYADLRITAYALTGRDLGYPSRGPGEG